MEINIDICVDHSSFQRHSRDNDVMIHLATRFVLIVAAVAVSAVGQNTSPNTIVGAGYLYPAPIRVAPGQVITLFAMGVGSTLARPVSAGAGNLPTSLGGISVTIQQGATIAAPILQVTPATTLCGPSCVTAITIQIPYELYQVRLTKSISIEAELEIDLPAPDSRPRVIPLIVESYRRRRASLPSTCEPQG
jgi:hypothetical protein